MRKALRKKLSLQLETLRVEVLGQVHSGTSDPAPMPASARTACRYSDECPVAVPQDPVYVPPPDPNGGDYYFLP